MSQFLGNPTSELLGGVPFEFAREHKLLPLEKRIDGQGAQRLVCLSVSSEVTKATDNLSIHLNLPIQLEVLPEAEVDRAIREAYQSHLEQKGGIQEAGGASDGVPTVEQELLELSDRELLATGGKAPVARLVDSLLFDALQRHASDLHIHPYPPPDPKLVIRYRIDGVLVDAYAPDPDLHEQLVGRIKVLAGMDVAEKRLPQDGRTSVSIGGKKGRQIDLRVSTLPTTSGERVVIRLLEQTAHLQTLGELGMPLEIEKQFQQAIRQSHGLVLLTGPTGSGKTTTLYSALSQLDAKRLNILTLEDPVEYQLQGISQTQVATKKGMTFASALRHVLRQDPDVIFVGEVRDEPTARMVIQSSMTGHLVLTTLHTNSAAGAIARLADLGIEPYLIASCLIGVLAQRLVRLKCPACHEEVPTVPNESRCRRCGNSGYSGRLGLFEWLPVTSEIRDQITRSASDEALETLAKGLGMKTLWQQGVNLVNQQRTTQVELHRVLGTQTAE